MHVSMIEYQCWVCGTPFAVSENVRDNIREKNLCPRGCKLGLGKSHYQQLQEAADARQREMQAALNQAQHAKLVAEKETKKAIADKRKVERRIAHGVCPCCNKTFNDIANHMVTEHKEFRLPAGRAPKQIAGAAS